MSRLAILAAIVCLAVFVGTSCTTPASTGSSSAGKPGAAPTEVAAAPEVPPDAPGAGPRAGPAAAPSRGKPAPPSGPDADAFADAPYVPRAEVLDEVDELLKRLKPPARFAGHVPEFTLEKRTFTFEQMKGPEAMEFHIVKDRDRYVAIMPTKGFHCGIWYVQDFRPTHAPKELALPTERWHIDTSVGTELRTDAMIPQKANETGATFEFEVAGETVRLVRRWKGTAKFRKWSFKTNAPVTVDTTNSFVLKCDPVLGYVVEGTWENAISEKPGRFEYYSAATSGRYSVWPGEESCYRVAICPTRRPGYEGYAENLAAIDLCDNDEKVFTGRDGGFSAFLNDRTGWSFATTIRGGTPRFVVCNAHADLDFVTPWPADAPKTADGLYRNVVRGRICALPPELTKHVWDEMSMRFEGLRKVQLRVGALEDFEEQPLPVTTRVRGLAWTHTDPEISSSHARSGRKSLVVKGRVWPNLPQVPLKPNARYHLEAWVKIADAESDDAEACIVADFYEWSPHSGEMVVKQRTTAARPGGDEWQKVELDFDSPKWGPFVNIAFEAKGCTAYVDDFRFARVDGQ